MSRRFCEWAACRNPATAEEDGFFHCRPHLYEHRQLREEDGNAGTRVRGPRAACGTRSGFNGHWRRSEQPCDACATAERDYQRSRPRRDRRAS